MLVLLQLEEQFFVLLVREWPFGYYEPRARCSHSPIHRAESV